MPRVIQIRDVPDEVHDALVAAAAAHGLSLTRYLRRELDHLAGRSEVVARNAAVARGTQGLVDAHVDRQTILDIIREGRGD